MTRVAFLNAQRSSAQTYVSVLTCNNSAVIFGTAFPAVTVDVGRIGTSYVSLAGELTLTVCKTSCCHSIGCAHEGCVPQGPHMWSMFTLCSNDLSIRCMVPSQAEPCIQHKSWSAFVQH